MPDNNTMYRMYKEMTQGYKLGSDGQNLFEHAVKCWLDQNPENPFQEDSEAFDVFFRMKNYYSVWRLGGADKKISMRRMYKAAEELCELKEKNPYKYDKKEAEEKKAALKEDTVKKHEEYIQSVEDAKRRKAEHDEEVRRVMEELNQTNIENEERANIIQDAVKEAEEKHKNKENDETLQKHYVFNAVEDFDAEEEEPSENEAKPGKIKVWLKRLLKL